MTRAFTRLGELVVRLRWPVVVTWLILVALSLRPASRVAGELASGGIGVAGSESDRGDAILDREFDRRMTRTVVAVFRSERLAAADPRYAASVVTALGAVRRIDGVGKILSLYNSGATSLVSADGRVSYAIIGLDGTEDDARRLVPRIRQALHDNRGNLDASWLTGFPAIGHDLATGSQRDLVRAELLSLPIILLLLLFVFGAAVAAALPATLGAAAVVTAMAGLHLVSRHVETSIFAMNTASMIGLGLGVDFSLLMVSRFREELAAGLAPAAATVRTVATAGQSIVLSGLTVMLGLAVMLLYDLMLVRSIALGMLMVAAMAVLGAVTLLPALLCVLGARVNALRLLPRLGGNRVAGTGRGRWHAWSLLVMRHPWRFLLASLAVLIALAIPVRDMDAIGIGGARGISREAESRQGLEVLTEAFSAGEVSPISIVIRMPHEGGALAPDARRGLFELVKRLEADPRVARTGSLVSVAPDASADEFAGATAEELVGEGPKRALVGQVVNLDGARDTLVVTVASRFDETDARTTALVQDLRESILPGMRELQGAQKFVTGSSALNLDYRDALYGRLPLIVGLVLLATFASLMLFLGSVLLPIKAILMNVVGILASYGVLVMVFQWGLFDGFLGFEHAGRLTVFPPVILFSILFGLSTDYEVFLLSRVKEIHAETGDNEQSVAEGLERTAGIITAAASIMIVVFGAFALGDVLVIKELGLGLAVAVFLDATIIRIVLVPASMKLLGHLNWWMPGR